MPRTGGFGRPVAFVDAVTRSAAPSVNSAPPPGRSPVWPAAACSSAAILLGADKEPEVLQALQDALADKDWSVRAAAVHAIALRNDPALEPDLVPLLEDRKEAVRVRAAAGYLRLEGIKSARNQQLEKRIAAPLSAAGKN
jgi:hypothetical protein